MSSFFFSHVEKDARNEHIYENVENYAKANNSQFFLLSAPLAENRYSYDYEKAIIILSPKHKILIVNFDEQDRAFEDYVEDFKEDLGYISDKYRYKEIIGRPRHWSHLIETVTAEELDDFSNAIADFQVDDGKDQKKCELMISLLTGSINNVEAVKGDVPDQLLDKIKQKIVLFDGDQTRFIYKPINKKAITIQGLSGTGKTELLLHKLKEIYVGDPESKVMFTCFNKVLADSLRKRIPTFFNFMKVEEQIEWNKRLWCVHSWGSGSDRNSGAYRYICHFYGLSFLNLRQVRSFDEACKIAMEEIKAKGLTSSKLKGYAFDYMLIDESQDFGQHFKELCELITAKKVYFAGDVFQSIFGDYDAEISPDFLLSKCYRTDPRTLMFAHGLGLGLFENTKLRWLSPDEWKACGYLVAEDKEKNLLLTREPLRRFEDTQAVNMQSVEVIPTDVSAGVKTRKSVIDSIVKIRDEHPTVQPEDIGIIFMDTDSNTFNHSDVLASTIYEEFGWGVTKAYEVKTSSVSGEVYITNRNNVKGLEFPFVICICRKLNRNFKYRNALYMMLTRSFIKSFLILPKLQNEKVLDCINTGLNEIVANDQMCITLPTQENMTQIEQMKIEQKIQEKPLHDRVNYVLDDYDILPLNRPPLMHAVKIVYEQNQDISDEDIREIIQTNIKLMGN